MLGMGKSMARKKPKQVREKKSGPPLQTPDSSIAVLQKEGEWGDEGSTHKKKKRDNKKKEIQKKEGSAEPM